MAASFARAISGVLLGSVCATASLRASAEGDDLRAADAELNTAYEASLEAMPTAPAKARLREAQRAWIAFREAEVAVNGALPGATGNTLKMLQTELTQTRTSQLKALADSARTDGR